MKRLLVVLLLLTAVVLASCQGPPGPQGAEGPPALSNDEAIAMVKQYLIEFSEGKARAMAVRQVDKATWRAEPVYGEDRDDPYEDNGIEEDWEAAFVEKMRRAQAGKTLPAAEPSYSGKVLVHGLGYKIVGENRSVTNTGEWIVYERTGVVEAKNAAAKKFLELLTYYNTYYK